MTGDSLTCPACRAENPPDSRFCNQCGSAIAVVCPACQATNPPESRFCNRCGSPIAPPVPAPALVPAPSSSDAPAMVPAMSPILGDEDRRPVTVVFADIVGFTGLSEQLDPEVVRDITAACFGRLVEEIAQRGGTVDKFVGDAVMALFGSPVAHEDDPARAVDAALAMQAALGEINGELERDYGRRLELRIGVDTGEVVAGVRQIGGLQDATVIGDAVNTASRLQAVAVPGTVVVGETTARLADEAFELEPLPPLTLRGKSEPVVAFRALGPRDGVPVADVESARLVGRQAELRILAEHVGRLTEGQGQVLVITGEPGIGKSRLLGELRRLIQANPRLRWAEAQAAPYGPGQTYKMYASTLRELFGIEDLSTEEAIERLRFRLNELDASEALPFVSHLLDLPVDPSSQAGFSELGRGEVRRRANRAMRRLYLALGQEKPYVLAVDDLQWADPAVVDFLEGALALVEQAPIMLCFVFRPDPDAPVWPLKERAAAELPDRYTEICLGPLTGDQTRDLVRELLGMPAGAPPGAAIGEQAEALLLARIEGNPLFAEEVVSTLVERGALARKNGVWQLDVSVAGRVPETLQATILARIDRLPEEARQVIQTGAVLGRSFSRQLLARVAGDGPILQRGLREALRAGLLRERPGDGRSEPGYTFGQRLVQEVAERTLLVRRRKELHAAAAEAIEALYPNRLAQHANLLARHAYLAEDWPAAARYARLAAERSAESHANRDALKLYLLGLKAAEQIEPAPSPRAVAELLSGKAEVLSNLGRVDESAAALVEALEYAARPDVAGDEQDDPARFRARLALELARARIDQFDVDAADHALKIAMANIRSGMPERASASSIRSWILVQLGDLPGAAAAAREALRVALEDGGFEERAEAYGALIKPALAGEIRPGIKAYAEEAIRLAREHQHDGYLFEALVGLEMLRLVCLQPYAEEALSNALEAVELAGKLHDRPALWTARVVLGATYLRAGRWDEAEQELRQVGDAVGSIPMVEALRTLVLAILRTERGQIEDARALLRAGLDGAMLTHGEIWFNAMLAVNRRRAGDASGARAALAAAEVAQAALGCVTCEALLGGTGAEVLARLGDARAADLARRADAAGDGAFPIARLQAANARAVLAIQDGDPPTAIAELEAALVLADQIGQPYERARTLGALAEARALRAAPGDAEAAIAALEEVLATFTRLGAAPERDHAQARLSALRTVPAIT